MSLSGIILTPTQQLYVDACKKYSVKPNSAVVTALCDVAQPTSSAKPLREIDMHVNFLGPKGVLPLLEVLQESADVRYLSLENNGLNVDSVLFLVERLQGMKTLESVDLSRNRRIGAKSGAELKRLVSTCPRLASLNLNDTIVPRHLQQEIAALLEDNKRNLDVAEKSERSSIQTTISAPSPSGDATHIALPTKPPASVAAPLQSGKQQTDYLHFVLNAPTAKADGCSALQILGQVWREDIASN